MYFIAEIGVNHLGSEKIAKKIIEKAKETFNVDFLFKVQIRTPEICVPKYLWNKEKIINGEKMSYLEYKKRNELDWGKILKDEQWFASCWDIPALKRYLADETHCKILKIPAVFAFKQQITYDMLEIAKGKIEKVFISLPIVELGYKNVFSYIIKIKDKFSKYFEIVPFLTFMSYNSKKKFNFWEIVNFPSIIQTQGFNVYGYSSHLGSLHDFLFARLLGYDYHEAHCAVNESKDSSDFGSSLNLDSDLFSDTVQDVMSYSYEDVDFEKINFLIPERWK